MTYPRTTKAAALPGTAYVRTHPAAIDDIVLTAGPLAAWQDLNARATIPHCIQNMESAGTLDNFRRVVAESGAEFAGLWFMDSDLYKVIEAVAWEMARSGTHEFDEWLDEVIALVGRAQDATGYVDTWIQGVHPEKQFTELELTHELYVLGHMIQAAVALDRAAGRGDLLRHAIAFADLIDRRFGPGREDGICGHPEIESALIELYRHTGNERYLRLSEKMINLRGHRTLPLMLEFDHQYFQDDAPVRDAHSARGHAVRQLYLNAGVTDLYLESGEAALIDAMNAQWTNAHERKMYISGGFGARHRDEAFGDDYELPSDRAYAETCATIADLYWTWRMLLAGGQAGYARYAEVMEREIYNALAASIDESGTRFFYSNPLQLRPDRASEENAPRERRSWYRCACCPPNIARTVAQLSSFVASHSDDTVWIHQIAPAELAIPHDLGTGTIRMTTDYPASGKVDIEVQGHVRAGARIALRLPSWGQDVVATPEGVVADGYWIAPLAPESTLRLDFPVAPRLTYANPKVDALRGCAAIECGPVLYCVEDVDLPEGVDISQIRLTGAAPTAQDDGTLTIEVVESTHPGALYGSSRPDAEDSAPFLITAVPFATWGNRGGRAMRVWLPLRG